MTPNILFIDIETSPIVAHVWQMKLYKTNIRQEQVLEDTTILSFAAKWLGEKEVIYQDQSKSKDIRNDKPLLLAIRELLDKADIVVVQNGVAFDIPTIKARMLSQKISPPSPFKMIDTCLLARKMFNFSYNSLDFLARALKCKTRKHEHKRFPGISLWNECMLGNKKAWAEMQIYNKDDVIVLEEAYLAMRGWIDGHPNVGIYIDSNSSLCPKCGSDKIILRGFCFTNTGKYQRYKCNHCGGWSRGRNKVGDKDHARLQLTN
jgi:hypothetical protein